MRWKSWPWLTAIEAAWGLVQERFALCQTLPLEQFNAVAAGMANAKYRLLQLRPYVAGPRVQVAALWTRDGQAAQWAQSLTADQVENQDTARRAEEHVARAEAAIAPFPAGAAKGALLGAAEFAASRDR